MTHFVFGSSAGMSRSRWFLPWSGLAPCVCCGQIGAVARQTAMPGHQSRHPVAAGCLTELNSSCIRDMPITPLLASGTRESVPTGVGCRSCGCSPAACSTRHGSRWPTPSGIDTSAEQDRDRASAESADTSARFPGEERCCIAQKISLLLYPGQFALERGYLLVTRHARDGEGLRLGRLQLAPPTIQNPDATPVSRAI